MGAFRSPYAFGASTMQPQQPAAQSSTAARFQQHLAAAKAGQQNGGRRGGIDWRSPELWQALAAAYTNTQLGQGPTAMEVMAQIQERKAAAEEWKRRQEEAADDEAWEEETRRRTRQQWDVADAEPERQRTEREAETARRRAELEQMPAPVRERMTFYLASDDDAWSRALDKAWEASNREPDKPETRSMNGRIVERQPDGTWREAYVAPERPERPRQVDPGAQTARDQAQRARLEAAADREARRTYDERVAQWEESGRKGREPVWANHWNREAQERGLPLLPGGDPFWYRNQRQQPGAPPPGDDGPPPRTGAAPAAPSRLQAPPSRDTRASAAAAAPPRSAAPAASAVPTDVAAAARTKGFDVDGALRAGYTMAEIRAYLGLGGG